MRFMKIICRAKIETLVNNAVGVKIAVKPTFH
jgi:hypothetical protein